MKTTKIQLLFTMMSAVDVTYSLTLFGFVGMTDLLGQQGKEGGEQ